MSLTTSQMRQLGTTAPDFKLSDVVSGEEITLKTFQKNKGLLVMFICVHCPFVFHVENELALLGKDYEDSELGIVAISSNDTSTHPEDAPEHLKAMAQRLGFTFPYCYDETQEVAKAYHAACTPDFFLYDENRKLAYRGQLDDSRPGRETPITGADLRGAINAVLTGQKDPIEQKSSVGCNIKWKKGSEPDYFG